jgi:lysophospholipase L1-like esterase
MAEAPHAPHDGPTHPRRFRIALSTRRRIADIVIGLAVSLVCLALTEASLRIVGFEYDTVPHRVELIAEGALKSQRDNGEVTQRHPGLFWALVPGAKLGELPVNEAGFLGPMPTLEPRNGVYRIVCLGDSNVALGSLPYPQELQKILDAKSPGRFEVINAGVPGYTLLQGLRLLEGRVLSYAPDLVTVQYGWNDHWMTDKPMSQKIARAPVAFRLRNVLRGLRIYQVLLYAQSRLLGPSGSGSVQYNVPPNEYREYLTRIANLGSSHGFRVALMTVPSNFKLQKLDPFLRVGFRPDHPDPGGRPEGLIKIHSELNDIVRDVAVREGTTLVDLDERFAPLQARDDYFIADAIHTSQRGKLLVAETLANEVLNASRAGSERPSERATFGVGRYPVSDTRVALEDFSPMEASPSAPDVFQAAIGKESQIRLVGVRRGRYLVALEFARDAAGRSVLVAGNGGDSPEQVSIGESGRAKLATPRSPDADGVLALRLDAVSDDAKPALVAVELSE